jgi:hypothetical protein
MLISISKISENLFQKLKKTWHLVMLLMLISAGIIFTGFHESSDEKNYKAIKAPQAPIIDGIGNEAIWNKAPWKKINHVWLGQPVSDKDFEGKFKAVWTKEKLFLLVEIIDDSLMDIHPDGLDTYWDDDCVEVFIDENHSGGNHQYSHNAFAYHIALDYKVADMGPDSLPHYYNDHVKTFRTKNKNKYTWELAITIYDDTYKEKAKTNKIVSLTEGKKMGFAIAYCDNDTSKTRENFIGSVDVEGTDKNRGWIDAGIFGTMELVK